MEVESTGQTTASTSREMECSSIHQLSGTVSSGPALLSEDGTALQSSAPQLPEDETNKIIENLFSSQQISKCITSINVGIQVAMEFPTKRWFT